MRAHVFARFTRNGDDSGTGKKFCRLECCAAARIKAFCRIAALVLVEKLSVYLETRSLESFGKRNSVTLELYRTVLLDILGDYRRSAAAHAGIRKTVIRRPNAEKIDSVLFVCADGERERAVFVFQKYDPFRSYFLNEFVALCERRLSFI